MYFQHSFWEIPVLEASIGIVSAPEVFQKCIAQRLEDLDGVVNLVDDILVWGEDMEQHDKRLRQLLDRIRSINLKLNKDKCKIRMTEVSYVGHILTADGFEARQRESQSDTEHARASGQSCTNEVLRPASVSGQVCSKHVRTSVLRYGTSRG